MVQFLCQRICHQTSLVEVPGDLIEIVAELVQLGKFRDKSYVIMEDRRLRFWCFPGDEATDIFSSCKTGLLSILRENCV